MRPAILALLMLAGCAGGTQVSTNIPVDGAIPPHPVVFSHPEYEWRVVFVTPDRMRRLTRLFRKPPNALGMAMWRQSDDGVPMRTCVLYLRNDATYDVLAHEARHCLEGHFHPPGLYAGLGGPPLPTVRQPEGSAPRHAPLP